MGGGVTDAQLLARARAGETEAYVDLFARHHQHAVAAAREFAGPDAADDIVAEAFVRILACIDEGGGPRQSFETYLDVTLHRAAAIHLRHHPVPTESVSLASGSEGSIAVPEATVLDPSDPRAARTPALQTFALLAPRAQLALWLREVEEVPASEVAELLGIDASQVDELARRAATALGQQHPGFVTAHLLPLLAAAPISASHRLAAVPASLDEGEFSDAIVLPPSRRWLPGLVAAAAIGVVGVLAVSFLGRGPVEESSHQEAAVAPPSIGQPGTVAPGFNGGRIAPALLGGRLGANPATTTTDERPATTRARAATEDEIAPPVESPAAQSTSPQEAAPTDPPTTEAPEVSSPANDALRSPAKVTVAGVATLDDPGRHTVSFVVDAASESTARVVVTGEEAVIESVGGGASCAVAGSAATCTLPANQSVQLTVTVSMPYGGTVSVSVPGGESSASASVEVAAPASASLDEPTPTPAGAPDEDGADNAAN